MPQEYLRSETGRLQDRGVYLLLIESSRALKVKIGALGEFDFRSGYYVYVGTAQRNLRKRIERHLRKDKKKRWHIDYFLENSSVKRIFVLELSREYEEKIAKELSKIYDFVPKFGSSDTQAPSHLFYIGTIDQWDKIKTLVKEIK